MSFIKLGSDNFERYTLIANPRRIFSSASSNVSSFLTTGITGTLPLFADGTQTMKDVFLGASPTTSASNDYQVENVRAGVISAASAGSNIYNAVLGYMGVVNSSPASSMFSKRQSVIRFEPGEKLDSDFQRKRTIKEVLFPFYRASYPSLQYSYTNYHTLNFVTCSYLATGTVLMYPASTGTVASKNQNFYAPSSSFTFDFYVNPRYTVEKIGDSFRAGTLFHLSSSYAVSLITGSSIGLDGKPDGYRLILQLSQSAEIPPSSLKVAGDTVTAPGISTDSGFLFVSPDNALKRNTWHHVAIRWGGAGVQRGTGSFVVDAVERSTFVITSASVMAPLQATSGKRDADVLFVGNFFEGSNSGSNPTAGFFNPSAAAEHGTIVFDSNITSDPADAKFRHPLNAEVHDLKIFNNYRTLDQIYTSSNQGFGYDPYYARSGVTGSNTYKSGTSANDGLLFYVPPFFTKESPTRNINQTPFFYASGTAEDPFNVAMSFGVGGHELNLSNFTREFVRGFYPRPYGLEAARVNGVVSTPRSANYLIYESGSNRKRNITVLPCDNGKFYPNFQMLLSGNLNSASGVLDTFKNDFGALDLSRIDLRNMVDVSSLLKIDDPSGAFTLGTGSLLSSVIGATPEDPGVSPGNVLTILQRTKDPSSNEVVFFDVSNMFYGDQLKPGSIVLRDLSVTGTNGRVQVTLKDDGYGNLYRADSVEPHAKWASVGNVIYEEGILAVKSPNIPLFGSDAWEIEFEGQRNIHVLEINIPVEKGLINSSSNPTYKDLIPSDYPSETASSFVYLTGLQLHDENLNVVARANFAQPVVKRDGDKFLIRLRNDY